MNLRRAVGKNLVPVLLITVVYEIALPVLRPFVTIAIKTARAEVTKVTRASYRALPMSERPMPAVQESTPPAPAADKPAPVAAKPARKGSTPSAISAKQ